MSKSGSKGILSGLKNTNSKEVTNDNNLEIIKDQEEKLSVKRSFSLKPSTVRKLQMLKTMYDDFSITYNEIVDEAINKLFDEKDKENK